MTTININTESEDIGKRIDLFLSEKNDALTRSSIQKLCAQGLILVDDKQVSKNFKISKISQIKAQIPMPKSSEVLPQNIPLDIIYEDEHILVVNKEKGMVVHPAVGNQDGTLVNALLYHCAGSLSGIGGVARPGIVHRIDKDTSGVLVVAKSDTAHIKLSESVKAHNFTRIYNAITYGNIKDDNGTIDKPIGRNTTERKKMCVTEKNSRNAITHYEVIERYNGFTYISVKLETGRTHQIRVHMKYISHPLAGDSVYGPKKVIENLNGQCLHAKTLGFNHPINGNYLEFTTELPDYFIDFLNKLKNNRGK